MEGKLPNGKMEARKIEARKIETRKMVDGMKFSILTLRC